MSLFYDLYKTYKNATGYGSGVEAPPFMHEYRSLKTVIDVTITADGEIIGAEINSNLKGKTLIAVTAKSSARSSTSTDSSPHAINDKLRFMTSGYRVTGIKGEDGKIIERIVERGRGTAYEAYISQLKKWCESPFSCVQARAVLACLTKGDLIDRLREWIEPFGRNSETDLIDLKYMEYFVRWTIVKDREHAEETPRTWEDKNLRRIWSEYQAKLSPGDGTGAELDVVTGEMTIPRRNHPKPISAFANAKMISTSSQEDKILHFTGERFTDSDQLPGIGFETSNNIHGALSWLIGQKQAIFIGKGSLASCTSKSSPKILVVWCPDKPEADTGISELMGPGDTGYALYGNQAKNLFYKGIEKSLTGNGVSVCMIEKSTKGRFSIVFYRSFSADEYLRKIKDWHENLAWLKYDRGSGGLKAVPASVFRIAACASGMERVNPEGKHYLDVNETLFTKAVFSLMDSMLDGKRIPDTVINAVLDKASKPMSFPDLFEDILYSACAVLRHRHIYKNKKKGEEDYMLDRSNRDRSYLYGRLLAVYEKIETQALYRKSKDDEGKKPPVRITNARKYWNGYEAHPYTTRATLERMVNSYLNSLSPGSQDFYKNEIGHIEELFEDSDKTNHRRLSPEFLHGYYLERNYLIESGKSLKTGGENTAETGNKTGDVEEKE